MRTYPKIMSWHKLAAEFAAAKRVFVTEKLDGANMRVLVGRDVSLRFGSREMELNTSDSIMNFFKGKPLGWWSAPERREAAYKLLDLLQADEVLIFGEIVGWGIQKRIPYFPDNSAVEFFAFDIMVRDEFLPYPQFLEVCAKVGLPTVPLLFEGSPQDDEFQRIVEDVVNGNLKSALAAKYGNETIAEGVVIRAEPLFITTLGSYSIAKLKTPPFAEEKVSRMGAPKVVDMKDWQPVVEFLNAYVTEGRLHNVVGKLRAEGKIQGEMRDLQHIVPAFWRDLQEECGDEIKALLSNADLSERDLQHRVGKMVQQMYARIVTQLKEGGL
ncbi:MAG: RNA ligase family protein [Ignisphaera sp.]